MLLRFSWLLTVKLRGRTEAPDQSRGCTLSSRTRGELPLFFLTPRLGGMMQPEVFHGKANLQPGVQA